MTSEALTQRMKEVFEEQPAVLFDLDGTLLDSIPLLRRCYHEFLAGQGACGSDAEFRTLLGPSLREVVEILKERYRLPGLVDDLLARYLSIAKELYPSNTLFRPGALETLKTLREWRVRTALVTSSPREVLKILFAHHAVQELFDVIVSADDVERLKPDPEPYLKAARLLQVSPSNSIALEDSPTGLTSAIRAGVRALGIVGTCSAETLLETGAEIALDSPLELLPIFSEHTLDAEPIRSVTLESGPSIWKSTFAEPQIEAAWQSENARRHTPLRNGVLACFERCTVGAPDPRLLTQRLHYRDYIASRVLAATSSDRPITLGVSGIVRSGDRLLLGRRSESITLYPNHFELVPTGTLEPTDSDPARKMRQEFSEETGWPESMIRTLAPTHLFSNRLEWTWNILYEIELAPNLSLPEPTSEYAEFRWIRAAEFRHPSAWRSLRMVPASAALLRVVPPRI